MAFSHSFLILRLAVWDTWLFAYTHTSNDTYDTSTVLLLHVLESILSFEPANKHHYQDRQLGMVGFDVSARNMYNSEGSIADLGMSEMPSDLDAK
jgi:hypothetical protein